MTLTLPALAFITAISGIPGLNALPGLRGMVRHKPRPTATDSLPTPWKPASRLAIEHRFMLPGMPAFGLGTAPIKIIPTLDPRKLRVLVEPDSGWFTTSIEIGDVRLGSSYRAPLAGFSTASMQQALRDRWLERSRQSVNTLGTAATVQHTGLSVPIPVALPSPIQSILGPGGPALNVSGSESIRLSGTSDWTNQQTGLLGRKRSLFPSLDMQQDLNIQLEGQLSDRVKVNLLQNSANQVPLANRIAINYRGDEDDLVQSLDLGNTSLSLPGTQYVSYSGRNEGLFGVKIATRLGAMDLTALASKQEGRSERASYTGSASQKTPPPIPDLDYIKGQYFLLYDPAYGNGFAIDDSTIRVFRDDAIYSNDFNPLLGRAVVDPARAMYGSRYAGTASDTAGFRGRFDRLIPGTDYEILPDYYLFQHFQYKIIRLKQQIQANSNACLAVTYRATPIDLNTGAATGPRFDVGGQLLATAGPDSGFTLLKMLRAPHALQVPLDPGNTSNTVFDSTAAFEPVRELEMKNFYLLNGSGIDPVSFRLTIQRTRDEPPNLYAHPAGSPPVNYIEAVGLDNLNESVSPAGPGHDEKVDGTLSNGQNGIQSSTRYFVDYKNGILFFPDPRPFAPRLGDPSRHFFDALMNSALNRRVRLVGAAKTDSAANPSIYDKYIVDTSTDALYYIVTTFAATRGGGEITLGRGQLLDGSDVVTVNGERWTRDRDYTIEYDTGHISLKRQLAPTDQLNIDYSYAPLFAQAGKTLIGSAFRLEGRDRSLGGAFLYESKGAQDLRPRLGEEPSRTLITDMNTEWHFKPTFLTRLVDKLPGVRTTAPSDFGFQAEAGASFPNPNTRNEVFVDDMEGVRDAVSLSLGPDRWRWSSVPRRALTVSNGVAVNSVSMLDEPNYHNAEIHWFVPPNSVIEKDLKPTLSDGQGGKNPRQVLALSVPRYPHSANPGDTLWTGVTYPLDKEGVDLSRSQFLEVWINDFRDRHHSAQDSIPRIRGDHVKLHIDLGVVSEDQMRAPNRPPDDRLQSEDVIPRDGQLTVAGNNDEDTGYDGIKDSGERDLLSAGRITPADLSTAGDDDPEGDDYRDPNSDFKDLDPRKFQYSNGTEGNRKLYPYPDTEDLNLNGLVDQDEAYYEYTVALDGSSPYLETDVWRDFPSSGVAEDNGWRRYRIPLNDSLRVQFGIPDLSITRHVRIWLEGLKSPDDTTVTGLELRKPLVMIGGVDIVGSRWFAGQLTRAQRAANTTLTLNAVNTLDNADVYSPPFNPGETRSGNQALTRREQSMDLEFTELAPNDTLEAYRTFSIEENYSRYGALRWYATGFDIASYQALPSDSLFYFVRFASDERGDNYYEVKRRVPASRRGAPINWEEVRVNLTQMSNLKLNPDFPRLDPVIYRAPYGDAGDSVIIVGRPSFTRLRRISFGLINANQGDAFSGRRYPAGQFWFDEIRATDIAKDVGYANRLLVNGRFANLMSYNVSWNSRDADFLSVGDTRGSGSRTTGLAVTSQFDVHRFFEGTGIQLPVSLTYNRQSSRPRFSAGDDVVRTGAQQALSESRAETRTFSTNYSRVWTDRSNPFLRYSLGGLTANLSRTETHAFNPSGSVASIGNNAGVNWSVAPRHLWNFTLPFGKAKFYPLPERLAWNYGVATSSNVAFTRATDGSGDLVPSSDTKGRDAVLDFSADTRPVDLFSHHIEGHRILSLAGVPLDHIGFINFGRLTSWRQSFSANYQLQRGAWLKPRLGWSSNYAQNNDVQSENLSVSGIGNGTNFQLSWDLPFDQLAGGYKPPVRVAAPHDTGAAAAAAAAAIPRRPRLRWRDVFWRLGALQTDATLNRSSSYSRLTGSPSVLYLLGLAENPGLEDTIGRVRTASGNTSQTGLDWRTNARTRVPLMFDSGLSLRFSLGDRTNVANSVVARTREMRFPDFDVDYGKLAEVIRLKRFIKDVTLRTGWSRSVSTDYQGKKTDRTAFSTSNDLHPLLSMRGTLRGGTIADLSMNVRNTRREVYQYGTSTQTDNNTDFNLTLSRQYTQGQKVSFLGKTSTVRSNVSVQLATVYSHRQGATLTAGSSLSSLPVDETRLSMTGTGTYGFSSNVTGSAVLGFSTNHDHTRDILRRSVRVELRAQFTF